MLAAVGVAAVVVSAGVGALAARGVLRPLRQARTAAQDGMVAGQSLGRGSVTGSGGGSLGPYAGEIGFRSPTSPGGAIVLTETSAADGQGILRAAVVRVRF